MRRDGGEKFAFAALTNRCPLWPGDQVGVAVDASDNSFRISVTYILWSGVCACTGFTSAVTAVDEMVVCVDTTFGSVFILLCEMELLSFVLSGGPCTLTRFFLQ